MNRQKEIENAAGRIKALKELTNKIKVNEKLDELEKESAWIRKGNQTISHNLGNDILARSLRLIAETSIEIDELRENVKNKKVIDMIKIEHGLKDVQSVLFDFSKNDKDVSYLVNSKMNRIKDLRMSLKDNVNYKKVNELKQLVDILEEAKLIIIKIQIYEESQWPSINVD